MNVIKEGTKVVVKNNMGTTGIMVNEQCVFARGIGKTGILYGPVAGHGGDVWWVKHDDGTGFAPYWTEEIMGETEDIDVAASGNNARVKFLERCIQFIALFLEDEDKEHLISEFLKLDGEHYNADQLRALLGKEAL